MPAFDFDNAKSGRINVIIGVYTAYTGWGVCETGQLDPSNRWRAFFSFDTSSIPDTAVIINCTISLRRRADPMGDPGTYALKFSIGTFIGANLDGNAAEWIAGTYVTQLTSKPADKQTVDLTSAAYPYVNKTGDTDLKLWDDSRQNGGDPSWGTNFNKNAGQLCQLNVDWVLPELGTATATGVGTASGDAVVVVPGVATATGVGTATADGTVATGILGAATATGVGTASGDAVVVVPGAATATGVGTATADGTIVGVSFGTATATGVGTASGDAIVVLPGAATATGVGTATADGTVVAGIFGIATATGVGTASGDAVVVVPGVATATGVGTAIASSVVVWTGAATATGIGTAIAFGIVVWIGVGTATGVGTAAAAGVVVVPGAAVATGIGTAAADGIVTGGVARWGEPCEMYGGGPRRVG